MAKTKLLENSREDSSEEVLDVDGYVKKAIDFVQEGNFEEAMECFDEGIKAHPDSLEIYMEKADICFDLGENEKALECYDILYEKLKSLN